MFFLVRHVSFTLWKVYNHARVRPCDLVFVCEEGLIVKGTLLRGWGGGNQRAQRVNDKSEVTGSNPGGSSGFCNWRRQE